MPNGGAVGLRVLVVDDDKDVASVLRDVLVMFGCTVRIAHDGAGALDMARELAPDLALVDVGLPVMNGYEIAKRLRRLDVAPKRIVAITGHEPNASDDAFDEHMVKPLELDDVRGIVERAR